MSREEIDRILGEDLTLIDTTISKKLQTMDSITDKLKEKSNFLVQFQILLQQQINNSKFDLMRPSISLDSLAETEMIGPESGQRPESVQIEAKRQQISDMRECESKMIDEERELVQLRLVNAYLLEKNVKLSKNLKLVHHSLCETRQYLGQFLDSLGSYFEQSKKEMAHFFEGSVSMIIQSITKTSQRQIGLLRIQNDKLQQQLLQFRQLESNQLKQLTLNDLKEKQQFNITTKLRDFYSKCIEAKEVQNSNQIGFSSVNIQKLKENTIKQRNKYIAEKPVHPMDNYPSNNQINGSIRQQQSIKLPYLKPLTIGVPPIKNGFGVLKSGAVTIYRGMWVNGRFQGKGKLQWDNFCYEGEFKNGLFSGFGKLQMSNVRYIGKFENNKAEGEGTYQKQGRKISGFWRENELLKSY